VVIGVCPWTRVPDYGAVTGQLYEAILETFRERGIGIPVHHHEVRLLREAAEAAN
jgi:hypothetical protein